jgi:hypothetical protein
MARRTPDAPTVDDYFGAARELASLVERALNWPGQVSRGELRQAMEGFMRLDRLAERSIDPDANGCDNHGHVVG